MKVINRIISDIFDIYPNDNILQQLTVNNNIDISKILTHPLLHLNIIYCSLWNYVFKTYPTKKDFSEFIRQNNLFSNIVFDQKLLDLILNNFFLLKLGLLSSFNLDDIIKYFIKINSNLKVQFYVTDTIIQKIKYRYNIPNSTLHDNLLISIINIYNKYDTNIPLYTISNINPINGSVNETITFNDNDNEYMNIYEKIQFIIYKDYHFMMKLLDNVVVYIDKCTINKQYLDNIINILISTLDKHVVLINYTTTYDDLLTFEISQDIYNLLPCIVKHQLTISNNIYPCIKSLTLNRDNAIYNLRENININTKNQFYIDMYDKYIVNTLELMNINIDLNKYIILDPISNNSFKKNICIKSGLTDDEINKLSNKYNITFVNEEYADVVVDMNQNVNSLHYFQHDKIPILKMGDKYLKHMINGAYINDNLYEFLDLFLSNKELYDTMKNGLHVTKFIFNNNVNTFLWKSHFKNKCPIRSNDPRNGILLYCNFIIQYYIKNIDRIISLRKKTIDMTPNCVVIIDNRENILSVLSVLFALINLNESWACKIYTSKKAIDYYSKIFSINQNTETFVFVDLADVIHEPILDTPKFHIDIYNKLLMSYSFWSSLDKYEKCLLIQDDGVLLKNGIEKFFHFDYIGAPWVDTEANSYIKNNINKNLVGNGGFSLRTISIMKDIVTNQNADKNLLFFHNLNNIPEDVYFSKHIYNMHLQDKTKINIPTLVEASFFSSEEIINKQSIGCHKVWSYHDPKIVKEFLDTFI